jgi:hypothetical protein
MSSNPYTATNRIKTGFLKRWSAEDYPGAEARFRIELFVKDVALYILLPVVILFVGKSCATSTSAKKTSAQHVKRDYSRMESGKSQIIDFVPRSKNGTGVGTSYQGVSKRAPGTLIKIKLLNVVETYSTAPVHAQIVNDALGKSLLGGTIVGDANPDPAFERVTINFKFVKDPAREGVAVPISARALSLDGTLGLNAGKKEGFFARSVLNSATGTAQEAQGRMNSAVDFKEVLFRALTSGLVQEFGQESQAQRNRSQILTLQPSVEFFAELTDFFPGSIK